jgi:hypothetical protein
MSEWIPLGQPPSTRVTSQSPWQRLGIAGLLCLVLAFGALVEFRTAFLQRRMGDLEVFLRAAWAVRAGQDIYTITDSKGFHYHYPPLFALLLAPLADPPPGAERSWALPFPVSVALWYAFSVLCFWLAVDWLATAIAGAGGQPTPRGGRRWWAWRLLPLLACLPAIGASLVRGQVDGLLLLLLSGMAVAALRGRPWQAGFWLAGAICLKVIPAFVLLYPLWRRDVRWLAGCAAGLVLGLAVIPAAVLGPARTFAYYREWGEVLVRPALTNTGDQTRATELTDVTGTDSQSLLAIFHNTLHLDRATRPHVASATVRLAHWGIGGVLTAVLFLAASRRRAADAPATVLFLGTLTLLMLLLSPVCHLHYFSLSVLFFTGLLGMSWRNITSRVLGTATLGVVLIHFIANALPRFPGLEVLRDVGLAGQVTLFLWLIGCLVLWRGSTDVSASSPSPPDVSVMAA